MDARALGLAAVVVALVATLVGQHDRELWGPDEVREVGISLEMAREGDYVTPRLNGRPFLEKPPLFHALGAAIFAATGSRARLVARAPAILCALATLAATYALARNLGGARLGALSVLVLATTSGFVSGTHRAVTDNAIPPLVALAFLGVEAVRAPGATWRAWGGLGAAVGLAFLAKSAIGPAVILAGALPYLAWRRELHLLRDRRLALAAAACAAPIAAWLLALYAREGTEALRIVLVDNNWNRATAAEAAHASPAYYYALHMPIYLLPWTPLALVGAGLALHRAREGQSLPAAWFLGGLLLLSAAAAKRPIYLLPVVPAAAILAAEVLAPLLLEWRPAPHGRRLTILFATLAGLGLAGTAIADAVLRREDLGWAAAGLAGAAAGGAGAAWAIRRKAQALSASAIFLMTALSIAFGNRAGALEGDRYRGFEAFGAEVVRAGAGSEVILFRPTETVRGATFYFLERTVPEVYRPEELRAARECVRDRGLVVVAVDSQDLVEATLGRAEDVARRRVYRNEVSMSRYPRPGPLVPRTPAPTAPRPPS